MDAIAIQSKLREIEVDLNKGIRQQKGFVRRMLASAVSGLPHMVLGSRGQAKSAAIRRFALHVKGANTFQIGCAKTTKLEDIVGAPDLPTLKATGKWKTNTEGKLTEAEIVFLDEVNKLQGDVSNSLLNILNEREFEGTKIKTRLFLSASNEDITELRGARNGKKIDLGGQEDSLMPFRDRFFFIDDLTPMNLGEKGDFKDLFKGELPKPNLNLQIGVAELSWLQDNIEDIVSLPEFEVERAYDLLVMTQTGLANRPGTSVEVSPRRVDWMRKALKALAFMDGRTEVSFDDFAHLEWAFWLTPDQRPVIREMIRDVGSRIVTQALAVEEMVGDYCAAFRQNKLALHDNKLAITMTSMVAKDQAINGVFDALTLIIDRNISDLQEGVRTSKNLSDSDKQIVTRTVELLRQKSREAFEINKVAQRAARA